MLAAIDYAGKPGYWTVEDSLDELGQLANTAGAEVAGTVIQRREHADPAIYFGRGKLDEMIQLKEDLDYTLAIFDDELSPTQQRNLENALNVKVLDRTALILDIFAGRARTREGRLQVQLAQDEYLLPRLAGQWSHLERLGGGIGTRGPGETQIETDRRQVRGRISALKRELEEVRTHRHLYRANRRRQGKPVAALVGYTNAGKSTLLNALTDAGVLAENKLFATLDPTTRQVMLPGGQQALFTDTVGFIQKLPTKLVEAFRATLEELEDADVLVHVLDVTHPNAEEQKRTVDQVLRELGIADKPVVLALNKADKLFDSPEAAAKAESEYGNPGEVYVSAEKRWRLTELLMVIQDALAENWEPVDVVIPYGHDNLVRLVHLRGQLDREDFTEQGVKIEGRVPKEVAALLTQFKDGAAVS